MLYGGKIDKCKLDWKYHKSVKVFDMLVQYEADNTTSLTHLMYACVKTTIQNAVRKKETIHVSVVSTGQRNGIVPAEVRSYIESFYVLNMSNRQLKCAPHSATLCFHR